MTTSGTTADERLDSEVVAFSIGVTGDGAWTGAFRADYLV